MFWEKEFDPEKDFDDDNEVDLSKTAWYVVRKNKAQNELLK
mgnify:CR=1 FL=1